MISAIGVLIFAGLIACDTQRLKLTFHRIGGDAAALGAASRCAALSLYLDFISLSQFLLNLFGQRG